MMNDLKDLILKTPGAQRRSAARASIVRRRHELLNIQDDQQEPDTWAERYANPETAEELLKKLGPLPPRRATLTVVANDEPDDPTST